MRTCRKCGIDRAESEFRPQRRTCQICAREVAANYRSKHHDEVLTRCRTWHAENREADVEYRRRRGVLNRERDAAYQREYRERNRAATADRSRLNEARRRARLALVLTIHFSTGGLASRLAYYGGMCWMCRTAPFEEWDHVKPIRAGGAHILANLRPACRSCNRSKGSRWPSALAVA